MHFEIRESKDSEQPVYWALVGDNGEDLGSSETMHHKGDAFDITEKIIKTIREGRVLVHDKTL